MGVPKFYRWLSERFPQINQVLTGATILPEFDNFYLDMNGIIHACTHPNESVLANSLTVREMVLAIFRYIDRMVTHIVKPKKILFMAIDGVAPRAKLNQQRARRFRAAQDRMESIAKAKHNGVEVDENIMFDSNCITPGTEFMEKVGKYLKYFIRKKMKEDPYWRNLRIVFSGHDVPGEGEHKIMQFIRELRSDPNYLPNQRHCMYGQDADLIMLGLASHEPHFALLREVINFNSFKNSQSSRQTVIRQTKDAQFQLLHLSILREYIAVDIASYVNNWVPDQERLIDDFIFLTFLVGNDFLPHLPTLDISEHAFDVIIGGYRDLMSKKPGYIVHNGDIGDVERLESLFAIIGQQETDILQRREIEAKKMAKRRRNVAQEDEDEDMENEANASEEALQLAFEDALLVAMGRKVDGSGEEEENEWQVVKARTRGGGGDDEDEDEPLGVNKDYRGRYYYDKFKVLVNSGTQHSEEFLVELRTHYLRGLMWCLAYYIKGCISWTWYYPYHYGPMLQDMKGLVDLSNQIHFDFGQPFQPFQQLLGCLPPASCNLLPKPYQWLMTSSDSPVKHFYPIDFKLDQDGKKNPWEAVVLLDFIDEVKLLQAEQLYCASNKLTEAEKARNVFGHVLTHLFDPYATETYPANDTDGLGLQDIAQCQSAVTLHIPSLVPLTFFKPALIEGTVYPIAGFPSLTILPVKGFKSEFAKINVFGTASKYKSVLIEIQSPPILDIEALNPQQLLGRTVYVNYPHTHEAKVVAISCEEFEYKLEREESSSGISSCGGDVVVKKVFDVVTQNKWKRDAVTEEEKYRGGRGTPGSGGVIIGEVKIRLRVVPLQGLQRNPITGSCKKKFGESEADVPIQMVLWVPPVMDERFKENDELTIEELMPVGSEVVAVAGDLLGCKGVVVGPHTAEKSEAKQHAGSLRRLVDVEFSVPSKNENSFGYTIAKAFSDDYYSSRDLCSVLHITPSVLGKIVGSIKLDNRLDIGLNLKRNGSYQLLGYTRRVDFNKQQNSHRIEERKVWEESDTIQIIGSASNESPDAAADADNSFGWEYSAQAATLIHDFKAKFAVLFAQLESIPHQSVYACDELFGENGKKVSEEVMDWMKAQPFFSMPRTPFTTQSLSRKAMKAIEQAANVVAAEKKDYVKLLVKQIPVEKLYCDIHRTSNDTSLSLNCLEPQLGDRIVNLTSDGVPFGFRGTVITIHSSTNYVEVLFDSEFINGKALQGSCSQFRGKLCPWSSLILISRPKEYQQYIQKARYQQNSTAALRQAIFQFSDGHVMGQFPAPHSRNTNIQAKNSHNSQTNSNNKVIAKGHVTELTKGLLQKKVGPTVSVATLESKSDKTSHMKKLLDIKSGSEQKSQEEKKPKDLTSMLKGSLNISSSSSSASTKYNNSVPKTSNVVEMLRKQFNIPTVNYCGEDDDDKIIANAILNTDNEDSHSLGQSGMTMLAESGFVSTENQLRNDSAISNTAIASQDIKASSSGKKIVLNKQASMRIIKHELKPNPSPAVSPVSPVAVLSSIQPTMSTSIDDIHGTKALAPADTVPPATATPSASTVSTSAVDKDGVSPSARQQSANIPITAILARAKESKQQREKRIESEKMGKEPQTENVITKILVNAKRVNVSTSSPTVVDEQKQPTEEITSKMDITSILNRAKRVGGNAVSTSMSPSSTPGLQADGKEKKNGAKGAKVLQNLVPSKVIILKRGQIST